MIGPFTAVVYVLTLFLAALGGAMLQKHITADEECPPYTSSIRSDDLGLKKTPPPLEPALTDHEKHLLKKD